MLRSKKLQIDNLFKFFTIVFFLINALLLSQESRTDFKIQSNPNISDSWWLEKNNFGIKPTNFGFQTKWELRKSKIIYSFDIFFQEQRSYLNESFIKYNYSEKTFLRFGKYYRDFSHYLNDKLSSGHMLISHNAAPMPKAGLVTSQKIKKLPKVDFDFGFSHGFFEKNNFYKKAPFLHEKFLYLNIVNNNHKISIGLIHEAIWGGNIEGYGNQPSKFKDFLKILISEDGPLNESEPHRNALGNHLGLWDFYYQYNQNNKVLKLYYQHLFEDTSGLRFRNEIDGLWGIELKNYVPKTTILLEYLDTSHQYMNPPYVAEAYYNHTIYQSGWSYKNYTIGNPFIPHSKIDPTKIIHIGVNGTIISNYNYQIKMSKKIDINDSIKYRFDIIKKINNDNRIGIFIVNNDNKNNGLGFQVDWEL